MYLKSLSAQPSLNKLATYALRYTVTRSRQPEKKDTHQDAEHDGPDGFGCCKHPMLDSVDLLCCNALQKTRPAKALGADESAKGGYQPPIANPVSESMARDL
jgi:hypothetical protein